MSLSTIILAGIAIGVSILFIVNLLCRKTKRKEYGNWYEDEKFMKILGKKPNGKQWDEDPEWLDLLIKGIEGRKKK